MHCRVLNSISSIYSLDIIGIYPSLHQDVVTTKAVSRHDHRFLGGGEGGKIAPGWETLFWRHEALTMKTWIIINESRKDPDIYYRPSGAWIFLVLSYQWTSSLEGSLNMILRAFTKLIMLFWLLQHYLDSGWDFWKTTKILEQKHKIEAAILKIFPCIIVISLNIFLTATVSYLYMGPWINRQYFLSLPDWSTCSMTQSWWARYPGREGMKRGGDNCV